MKLTEKELQRVQELKLILKKGDRVRCSKCPGTFRTFTFSHWDGCWMVSKSGIDDFHPCCVKKINGKYL
jgi:hypothetical protein